MAVNLAGALALNAPTVLVDEDPIESCVGWARRANALPMPVESAATVRPDALNGARYLLVDTEGRPAFADVLELTRWSAVVLIPCGTSALELDATPGLVNRLKEADAAMDVVKSVITKAPPAGTVGQQARDALAAARVPVARAVVRNYAAHQRAPELGVLLRDVPDPRAARAWRDVLELAMEVVGQ